MPTRRSNGHVDPDELAFKAMKVLDSIFDHPAKAKDLEAMRVGRLASSYLSTYATMKQTENNAEAMRIMAARELAGENGEKFKRYLLAGPGGARGARGDGAHHRVPAR